MKTGLYPGCSLEGTGKEFDISLKAICTVLDVQLEEIDDWSCCGASSAHSASHLLALALPARNLALAKKQGLEEVVAPCAACFNRLVSTQDELNKNHKLRMKVEETIEEKWADDLSVINVIQLFQKIGLDKIKASRKVDLSWLNIACYYGCLLVRPSGIAHYDDAEQPTSMEAVASAAGANPVEWNFKTECCGAAHSISHTGIVEVLSKKILDNAMAHGADAVLVACPMCHSNLDMRQNEMRKHDKQHKDIPILYITELIGMSMGIDSNKLGLNCHFINPKILEQIQAKKKVNV